VASSAASTRSSTRVTPTSSDAFAESVAVPLRVAPAAGALIATVGGVVSGTAGPVVTRTATQSREKSRAVELATSVTRTWKLALASPAGLHVRPHVSAEVPRTYVAMLVVSVGVDRAAVQVTPPSHESCTHIFGAPLVPSTRASRRTSMPRMLVPAGTA